jgi:hypothetical protein
MMKDSANFASWLAPLTTVKAMTTSGWSGTMPN